MTLTMKMLSMTTALSLVLLAGQATGGDDATSDLAKLKGTWIRVLDGRTYVVNFDGDKFAEMFEFPGGTSTTSGTITIDPSKSPKQMDWKFVEATGRGEKMKGNTAQSIYEFDGETFKFHAACQQGGRPGKFPDHESVDGNIYLVFKRVR